MLEEVATDGLLALHDRVVDILLDTLLRDVVTLSQLRVEEDLRALEALLANDYLLAVWQHEVPLASLRLRGLLEGVFVVLNAVGHRLLHQTQLRHF